MPGQVKEVKDHQALKDHNGHSGSNWRDWWWFYLIDTIFCDHPASNASQGTLDSSSLSSLETFQDSGELSMLLVCLLKKCFVDYIPRIKVELLSSCKVCADYHAGSVV